MRIALFHVETQPKIRLAKRQNWIKTEKRSPKRRIIRNRLEIEIIIYIKTKQKEWWRPAVNAHHRKRLQLVRDLERKVEKLREILTICFSDSLTLDQ